MDKYYKCEHCKSEYGLDYPLLASKDGIECFMCKKTDNIKAVVKISDLELKKHICEIHNISEQLTKEK